MATTGFQSSSCIHIYKKKGVLMHLFIPLAYFYIIISTLNRFHSSKKNITCLPLNLIWYGYNIVKSYNFHIYDIDGVFLGFSDTFKILLFFSSRLTKIRINISLATNLQENSIAPKEIIIYLTI
jgi:hypothetical protein